MSKSIEVHALVNIPENAMNCNFLGEPKKLMFGGALRSYGSSQSYTRPTKDELRDAYGHLPQFDHNSRKHVIVIKKILVEQFDISEEDAELLSSQYLYFLTKDSKKQQEKKSKTAKDASEKANKKAGKKAGKKAEDTVQPDDQEDVAENDVEVTATKNDEEKVVMSLMSQAEIHFIASQINEFYKKHHQNIKTEKRVDAAIYKKDIMEIRSEMKVDNFKGGILSCFFGRMLSNKADFNKQATIMRGHMFTTHAISTTDNIDDFTAQDDLGFLGGEDATGAGHMNSKEFTTGCYYKCFILNYSEAIDKDHLGGIFDDQEMIDSIVKKTVLSLIKSLPEGKKNSFFANSLPFFIMINVVDNELPISYASAFEKPVVSQNGYAEESAMRIVEQFKDRQKWGEYSKSFFIADSRFSDIDIEKSVRCDSVSSMIDKAIENLK